MLINDYKKLNQTMRLSLKDNEEEIKTLSSRLDSQLELTKTLQDDLNNKNAMLEEINSHMSLQQVTLQQTKFQHEDYAILIREVKYNILLIYYCL